MFGEITQPLPSPPRSRAGAASQAPVSEGTSQSSSAVVPRPTMTATSPQTVSSRPSRSTSRPATAAATAEPAANGVTARPDMRGE